MKQISPKGKNSRGGKGARKRLHPGKVFTRNQSAQERKEETAAWAILQREVKALVKPKMVKGAEAVLSSSAKDALSTEPHKFWDYLIGHQQTYIPRARELHRQAVEYVYSVLIRMAADGFDRHLPILQEKYTNLARSKGLPLRPRTMRSQDEITRMIIRLALKFDLDEGKKDYNVVWRIVSSINNFLKKSIPPDQVKDLPGGIDDWHRSTFRGFRTSKEVRRESKLLVQDVGTRANEFAYYDDVPVKDVGIRVGEKFTDMERVVIAHCMDHGLEDRGFMLLGVIADPKSALGGRLDLRCKFGPVRTLNYDKLREDYWDIESVAQRLLTGRPRRIPKRTPRRARRIKRR